jgi:putative NADH-flavin reductase
MLLILGATGMFGSRVLRETAARGAPVRALVHSPERAAGLAASMSQSATSRNRTASETRLPASRQSSSCPRCATASRCSDADIVTDTYRELAGEEPTRLAQWLALNGQAFERPEPEQQAPQTTTT